MVAVADREIYPCAPLRLVAAEVKYPLAAALIPQDAVGRLVPLLEERFPLLFPAGIELSMSSEPGLPPMSTNAYRLVSRDQMTSVTVTHTRCAIETTDYHRWEAFREHIMFALEAVGSRLGAISTVERLGLRYINEIRLPEPAETKPPLSVWSRYVNPLVIAPFLHAAEVAPGQVTQAWARAEVAGDHGATITTVYGVLSGHTVTGSPLKLPTDLRTDTYVLLDIDSYQTPPEMSEFVLADVMAQADALHDPVRRVFESFITEELREDVLRVKSNG